MSQDDFSRTELPQTRINCLADKEERRPENQQSITDAPELRMIHDLRRAYQAEALKDARSLEGVLTRLMKNDSTTRSKILFLPHKNALQAKIPEMQSTMNSFAPERPETSSGRTRLLSLCAAMLCFVLLVGGFLMAFNITHSGPASRVGGAPNPDKPIYNSAYPPIDRVYCDQLEQTTQHIHVHVSIYIDGTHTPVPANVGVPLDTIGNPICFYWLHTHDASGVIHIESPGKETFTFGQFRDEWHQKFQHLDFPSQLLLNNGWVIWINGQKYAGTLEHIPLAAHNLITLAYNSPHVIPDTHYFWDGL